MKKHKNEELAHLKWRLINQDGLNPKQADERIEELKKWRKKKNEVMIKLNPEIIEL